MLGAWMDRRSNREPLVTLTKGCHPSQDRVRVTPYDLTSDLMDSLARLRTDYVDLYLLHRDDPSLPVDAIVTTMAEHHAAGRFGHDKPRLQSGPEALSAATYCSDGNFARLEAAEVIGAEHGVSAARVVLAYILRSGLDVYPIAASATPEEFADNAAALNLHFSAEEIVRLEAAGPEVAPA